MGLLITLISILSQIFIWILIASAILSFILPPYHPVREALDRIVDPFLNPIRRVVPLIGMIDISPLILYFLVVLVTRALIGLLQMVR